MSSTFSSSSRRELGVGVGARDERVQLVDETRRRLRRHPRGAVPARRDGDRDDLLGEHVERVARHDRRLDQAFAHAPGDDRALEQVAAELREDAPAADLADAVAGAPDALQPARDRLRRLDLQDEIDGAHVDPELERAGRDQARQLARLEQLLDLGALLARERAVVRAAPARTSRALLAAASSFRRSATRSAERRLLTNTIVERCSRTRRSSSG